MTEIDIEQFMSDPDRYIRATVVDGDMFTVKTKYGKLVLLEKPEYDIMRQAFVAVLGSNGIIVDKNNADLGGDHGNQNS